MKNLIQITTVLFLLVQTIGFSQTEKTESISNKQDTSLKKESAKTEIDTKAFENFIGKYYLSEADLVLEIMQEGNAMYLVTPFSKDILILKNKTTIHELTRGVDLELIENDKSALKYSQNGYETTIKRVKPKTEE